MTNQLTRYALSIAAVMLLLFPSLSFAQCVRAPAPKVKRVTHLRVEVTMGDEAEAVKRADVFVTSEDEDSPFDKTLKTDKNGVVSFIKVPRVRVLIQVTAAGCKTFGKKYVLEDESQTIAIRLQKDGVISP